MSALGIMVSNVKINHYVNWKLFLKMNALITYHCAPKQDYIDFWLKFFNPIGRKLINKDQFIDHVELMTRGRFTNEKTLISDKFANGLYLMLVATGCTSKDEKEFGEIKFEKLQKRL